jgi:poly(A) polymerase
MTMAATAQTSLRPGWLGHPSTQLLLQALAAAGLEARFSGGCVRDALLGVAPHDIDVAIAAPMPAIRAALKAAGLGEGELQPEPALLRLVVQQQSFDVLSVPDWLASQGTPLLPGDDIWQRDALRRDFTINALQMLPDGTLVDQVGGVADLRAGIVRYTQGVEHAVRTDLWRILRYFSFHACYGAGAPDEAVLATIAQHMPRFSTRYPDYVQYEMLRLLGTPKPYAMLGRMQAHGLLPYICGFDVPNDAPLTRLASLEALLGQPAQPSVRLLMLAAGSPLPLAVAMAQVMDYWAFNEANRAKIKRILESLPLVRAVLASEEGARAALVETARAQLPSSVLVAWALDRDMPITTDSPYLSLLQPVAA